MGLIETFFVVIQRVAAVVVHLFDGITGASAEMVGLVAVALLAGMAGPAPVGARTGPLRRQAGVGAAQRVPPQGLLTTGTWTSTAAAVGVGMRRAAPTCTGR